MNKEDKVLFDYLSPYERAKFLYENYIKGHGKRSTRTKRVLKRRLRLTKKRLDIFRQENGYEPNEDIPS